jgi:tetratricopeptide (TPR) repeat protein
LQRVFTRLVRPVHGEQDTRCRADAAEFGASAASLIKKLRDARLLVTSKTDTGNETLEIVHEALVRSWELLRRWADAERQFIVWQGNLNAAATKWRDSQRSTDLLLRGLPLAQAQDWQRRKPDVCAKLEREFVSASARRKTLRRGAAIGAAALVAITTGCLVVETVDERELADLARARAEQLVNFMIFDLRDKLRAIGRLDLMDSVTARVNEYYEKLGPRDVAHHAEYQRAANLTSQGDLAIAQGNLGKAREAYEQALAITEHLAKAEPANSYGQSVLGVSHIRLGDLEAAAGQLDAARKDYEQTLAISERLAKANPADSGSQQGLWLSYWKLGDVEVAAGQLDAARTDYEQDLAIAERLAKANPADSGSQQGLWLSYWKLGDVEVATGHLEAGRTDYEQALAIAEQLAKADPTNSGWQRELSVSHMKIGSVSSQQNQRSEALQHFNKALAISARFAKLDPSNAVWKHDLDWLKAEISALKGRKER